MWLKRKRQTCDSTNANEKSSKKNLLIYMYAHDYLPFLKHVSATINHNLGPQSFI